MQNDYVGFIVSAYGISAIAIVSLGLWIFLDARARRAELRALEASGFRRRSDRGEAS